jgi:hypothetical protein
LKVNAVEQAIAISAYAVALFIAMHTSKLSWKGRLVFQSSDMAF